MRRAMHGAVIALCAIMAGRTAHAQQTGPDRQIWADFVPAWRVGAHATNELELSFRTSWQGAAPTQYWATNTFEWNLRPWLGLDAMGALVESRGPEAGTGYFEMRPSAGVRLTWRGTRLRASEFMRVEHRMLRPLGGGAVSIERVRHREQVLWAVNHASLATPRTAFLIADAEWFLVHGDHGGWLSNQLRARAGLGYRWNERRSFELLLNDTRRRGMTSLEFEDGDHVLRVRWKEVLER
jgi:hypothetical protein